MLANLSVANRRSRSLHFITWMLAMAVSLTLFFVVTSASAQDQSQTQNPPQTDENAKPKQDAPPEAGGPGGDIGPYATPNKVEGLPDYSIHVNAPLVNVDVLVTTKSGQFVPGLKKDNFRLFEDGAPQTISSFNVSKA